MELLSESVCPSWDLNPRPAKRGCANAATAVWGATGLRQGRGLARCFQRPTFIASTTLFWFQTLAYVYLYMYIRL